MYSNLVETGDAREDSFFQPTPVVVKAPEQQQPQQQQQQPKQLSPKKPMAGGVSAILETERTRRMSMPSALTGPGGRRLSIPFSEQRRRSSYGVYSRVVMCAVDASGHSKDAFMWYLNNVWRMDDLIVICYCPEPPAMPSFSFKTGLTLPTERWKEILDEANAKTRKLEEDYEQLCIEKKYLSHRKQLRRAFDDLPELQMSLAMDQNRNPLAPLLSENLGWLLAQNMVFIDFGEMVLAAVGSLYDTLQVTRMDFTSGRGGCGRCRRRRGASSLAGGLPNPFTLRYKIRGESYKNAGEGLCRIADDEAVNLIVMGSRGMSALKRAFIGSVSEYVVRNASVPCLVIPAPK